MKKRYILIDLDSNRLSSDLGLLLCSFILLCYQLEESEILCGRREKQKAKYVRYKTTQLRTDRNTRIIKLI